MSIQEGENVEERMKKRNANPAATADYKQKQLRAEAYATVTRYSVN